jgi:putative ABC transport system permease protein
MIRQFFKVLWNNRRRNILVFIELFMISFILCNLTVYLLNLREITRIKNCYDTSDVVNISMNKKANDNIAISEQSFANLKQVLASNPFVEAVSFSSYATPYVYSAWIDNFSHDSDKFNMEIRRADIDYAKVMKIKPIKGRWFDNTDFGKSVVPILVSSDIDEKNFNGNSIGARLKWNGGECEIIGVTERFKRSDIESPDASAFLYKDSVSAKKYWGNLTILVRTKENMTAEMLKVAENQVSSTINPEFWGMTGLNSLENMRASQNSASFQRNYLTVILSLFIIINIFLGTIGILWYNTNLRIHEVGIRRAIGATGRNVRLQLVTESVVIAFASLFIVNLIIIQTPAMFGNGRTEPGVIGNAIWVSTIVMLILVLLSTWLPARFASKIRPATVLKTE